MASSFLALLSDARQIVDVWKIHLGEVGRTTLKKEISERTQADTTLKRRVLCIAKLKMATLEELVQIAEITGLLERVSPLPHLFFHPCSPQGDSSWYRHGGLTYMTRLPRKVLVADRAINN